MIYTHTHTTDWKELFYLYNIKLVEINTSKCVQNKNANKK
jgi:hypothetical protein